MFCRMSTFMSNVDAGRRDCAEHEMGYRQFFWGKVFKCRITTLGRGKIAQRSQLVGLGAWENTTGV
jgi:hypothetical protein